MTTSNGKWGPTSRNCIAGVLVLHAQQYKWTQQYKWLHDSTRTNNISIGAGSQNIKILGMTSLIWFQALPLTLANFEHFIQEALRRYFLGWGYAVLYSTKYNEWVKKQRIYDAADIPENLGV